MNTKTIVRVQLEQNFIASYMFASIIRGANPDRKVTNPLELLFFPEAGSYLERKTVMDSTKTEDGIVKSVYTFELSGNAMENVEEILTSIKEAMAHTNTYYEKDISIENITFEVVHSEVFSVL